MEPFRFKRFTVRQDKCSLKLGTDAVMLGAAVTLTPENRNILDVGTGCGVIALMVAQRLSDLGAGFTVTGIDIDAASAQEAAENFAASPWSENLRALLRPLQEYSSDKAPDLIVSNPPFYDESLRNPDPRLSTARHTGELSYRDILAFAGGSLSPDGRVALILPAEEEVRLRRTAASFSLYPFRVLRLRTSPVKPPRRIIAEFSRKRTECIEEELTIGRDTDSLTKDFYIFAKP